MLTLQSMLVTFIGIGLCTCFVFILVNPRLEKYLSHGMMTRANNQPLDPLNGSHFMTDHVRSQSQKNGRLKNVLFIIVDDLRPQLGAYFDPDHPDFYSKQRIHTPNVDKLASRSLLLKRAYVQQPLCGPSRASMLTSRRPDYTRAFSNNRYWRNTGGNFTTLPQLFKENGYVSLGFGKVFHTGASSGSDDPPSWSEPFYKPPFSDTHYMGHGGGASWTAVEQAERTKVQLTDDRTVEHANQALRRLAPKALSGENPFFLAVGFRKPHLSLVCPKEFYDLYPVEKGEQYLVEKSWQMPVVRKTCELGNTTEINGQKVISEDVLRNMRRAYFACVSYMDSNVGMVLDELDNLGLSNSTIISFTADHGYHLGDNNHWGKMKPLEMSTRVPMALRIPGMTDNGIVSESLVEAVDLYPTIAEAAGLEIVQPCPVRSSNISVCTQGQSFLSLIANPSKPIKEAAFSQVTALGDSWYTIRTSRFRYVEKAKTIKEKLPNGRLKFDIMWNAPEDLIQMYDHFNDPHERFNIVADPKYMSDRANLRTRLRKFVTEMHIEPKII